MGTLTVRKENLPTRCDVCHQSDVFDPESGICSRCTPVLATKTFDFQITGRPNFTRLYRKNRIFTWTIISLISPLFVLPLFHIELLANAVFVIIYPAIAIYFLLRCPNCKHLPFPQVLDQNHSHPNKPIEKKCRRCGVILGQYFPK